MSVINWSKAMDSPFAVMLSGVLAFILSCYTVVEVFRCQKQRVCSHDNISQLKEVFVVVR